MPVDIQTPLKCIVIDDEPMARDVMRRYISKLAALQLVGEFSNAIDAMVYLQRNAVDLMFLDIRMPELLGTDFVQSLNNPPKVIFTTAYKEYALDGYELNAIDYLLKPIRFERFLKAINKAFPKEVAVVMPEAAIPEKKSGADFIYLRVDRKLVRITLADIMYIESAGDYVKVFTADRSYVTRQTISSVEAMLDENDFVRIHRSYLISTNRISSFTNELVEIGGKELPLGKMYRNAFLKRMQ